MFETFNNTVAVAMSGGVDSSTVAAMLKDEGYELVGLTLQLWNQRRLAGKEGMPAEVRRRAKAINFGIVYGISGFGLANQLAIPQSEASDYIKKYFARFPGIRDYMEDTKQFARTHGFVETLFGRRIHIREINSKVPGFRAGAERAAINAPIQGAAADIIRRAMVRMPEALAEAKLDAIMLLQVHDELIFEAPEKETARACKLIADVMAKAPLPAVEISVPLVVEARAADNWDAAH